MKDKDTNKLSLIYESTVNKNSKQHPVQDKIVNIIKIELDGFGKVDTYYDKETENITVGTQLGEFEITDKFVTYFNSNFGDQEYQANGWNIDEMIKKQLMKNNVKFEEIDYAITDAIRISANDISKLLDIVKKLPYR